MQKEQTDLKCPQDGELLIKVTLTRPLDIYYVCQGPREHTFEANSPLLKNAPDPFFINYVH